VLPYNSQNGFNPLSFNEEKQNIIDLWNQQTGSTYTLANIVGTDLDLVFTTLANYNIYNQTEASAIVSKNMIYLQSQQLKIDAGLYSWNAFVLFLKSKGFLASREPYNETLEIYNYIQKSIQEGITQASVDDLTNKLNELYSSGNDAWNGAFKLYLHDLKETPTPDNDVLQLIFDNYQVSDKYIGNITANIADVAGNYYTYAYTKAIINSTFKVKVKLFLKKISNQPEPTDIDVRNLVFENYNENYSLGKDFEPIYYLDLNDVPNATAIEMYISKDGSNYLTDSQTQILEKSIYYKMVDVNQIEVERIYK